MSADRLWMNEELHIGGATVRDRVSTWKCAPTFGSSIGQVQVEPATEFDSVEWKKGSSRGKGYVSSTSAESALDLVLHVIVALTAAQISLVNRLL